MAWQYAIPAAASVLGGIMGGQQQGLDFKNRQHVRDMAYAAMERLNPSRTQGIFDQLMQTQGGYLNQIAAGNALAGQTAAAGAQAGLARAGLGNTGLGAGLRSGLNAGAAFQTNQLRARMAQEAMQSALGIQRAQASALSGVQMPMGTSTGWLSGAVQGAGSALTTMDAIGAFDRD